jgi:hypothetical protein
MNAPDPLTLALALWERKPDLEGFFLGEKGWGWGLFILSISDTR